VPKGREIAQKLRKLGKWLPQFIEIIMFRQHFLCLGLNMILNLKN
jgi:hypothetical protein